MSCLLFWAYERDLCRHSLWDEHGDGVVMFWIDFLRRHVEESMSNVEHILVIVWKYPNLYGVGQGPCEEAGRSLSAHA